MKRFILLVLLMAWATVSYTQNTAINSVAVKYRNWLSGTSVNYGHTIVNDRYIRFRNAGIAARDLSAFDFANPGAPWNFDQTVDKNQFFLLTEQKLIRLVMLYSIPGGATSPNPDYNRTTLRDTILMIFDYIAAKGVSDTTDFAYDLILGNEEVVTSSHGIALRSSAYATAIFLMKEELKAAGKFVHHMGALNGITKFVAPEFPYFNFTYPGYNSDVIRASLQQRLCYVLAQDDTAASRLANMDHLSAFINNSLLVSNGWADCIKPDFITYHHRGAYANTYGVDALHQASILCLMLSGSPYQLGAVAKDNLKKAVMNYRKFSIDFTMPRGLAGRFPTNTSSLNILRPALAYLYAADPIINADAGSEFVRLWALSPTANTNLQRSNVLSINMIHSMGGIQDMVNVLDAGLAPLAELTNGHFGFPYAGLSIHKYNGWQISVKGTSKIIWHFENGDAENRLGAYGAAGVLEILTHGNPVSPDSNGLSFAGWDWAHLPGTTVADVPFATMANFAMRQMNGKDFLAHAHLDQSSGIFAMDYKDYNSTSGMTALKTYFFFGDQILCLGSNIKDIGGTYPIHTTLFQNAISGTNTSLVNGTTVSGNNYNFSQNGGGLWATDAMGNGYVVPANSYNAHTVVLSRASQSAPDESNTSVLTGNFTKAYLDHGIAPAVGSYQYGIKVQGGAATADFLQNFNNYFSVIQQDSLAHIVLHKPDSTYCYVVWKNAALASTDVFVKSNKPAIIMTRKMNGGQKIKVSLTNPNLGLLAANESYSWGQISGVASRLHRVAQTDTVTIVLRGLWAIDSANANVSLQPGDTTTELRFNTKNGFPEQLILSIPSPLPISVKDFSVQTKDCHTVLNWTIATDAEIVSGIELGYSKDGIVWRPLAILDGTVKSYTYPGAGFFRIKINYIGGASIYSKVLRNDIDCAQALMEVYPNPVTQFVYLVAQTDISSDRIRVFNEQGKDVTIMVGIRHYGKQLQLHMGQLSQGIYTILVNGQSYKIVKQ
ncbi:polysaccharide lyase family 8 super-sandwich domain-containing protein [Taibaiella sp. KBW10]|uniref:polysaccharide lyase family 8 super-sandwich domain-containing protein n=1 Tax=Taibaiella sp. KBW10 TaxID=2153357 RepID=UPI000F5A9D1B|nr:polysaccharide lyase family 8 super-sandwich domain-containing protein [Taibaiella sp. KBW10]